LLLLSDKEIASVPTANEFLYPSVEKVSEEQTRFSFLGANRNNARRIVDITSAQVPFWDVPFLAGDSAVDRRG
jgi:hypothetical protein